MIGNLYTQQNMSQEDRILCHLIVNGKISNKECNEIYGFRHLPSVIRYLRKRNINIKSVQRTGENRFSSKVYWVDYTLAPPAEQSPEVNKLINNFKMQFGKNIA
ncbi:hypothetical protein IJX73_00765 [bacterium]|nr:hypothetical protein [bacterium]MBQ9149440.1 hypothetical protein [bacterium]